MMKSFRMLSLLAAAALACAVSASCYIAETVASVCRAARDWVTFRVEVVAKAFAKPEILPMPAIKFVAAMAYVLRQAKRERPTVTPRWRMCPSA